MNHEPPGPRLVSWVTVRLLLSEGRFSASCLAAHCLTVFRGLTTDLRRPHQEAGAVLPAQGPLLPPCVRQPLQYQQPAAPDQEEDQAAKGGAGA